MKKTMVEEGEESPFDLQDGEGREQTASMHIST